MLYLNFSRTELVHKVNLINMGNSCTTCCGKIQDWCRDICGCFPCTCCKTIEIEVKASEIIERNIEKKETPFGYGLIHAGETFRQ